MILNCGKLFTQLEGEIREVLLPALFREEIVLDNLRKRFTLSVKRLEIRITDPTQSSDKCYAVLVAVVTLLN